MRQRRKRSRYRGCHGARTGRSWQSRRSRIRFSRIDSTPCTLPHLWHKQAVSVIGLPPETMARVRAVRQKKPGASTVATCRCCGCRGPEQHLHATPWPRPKIGEADTDHQPVQRTPHARSAHISMAGSTCRGMTNWPCSSSHLRYRGVRCNGLRETGRMPWAAPRSHRRQADRAVDRRALSTAAGHPCRTPDSAEGPLGT
jgi:hypothetical protein